MPLTAKLVNDMFGLLARFETAVLREVTAIRESARLRENATRKEAELLQAVLSETARLRNELRDLLVQESRHAASIPKDRSKS